MKLSHAAVLALVGWYLMVPIPGIDNQPISTWSHIQSYDTAKECEDGMTEWFERHQRDGFALKGFEPNQVKNAFLQAECIATDDPRLKGN